ncbi:TetR/AcrR family transcriptional regulator [Alicyclobacillus acidoterrestris]|uniref:TetR/AcrR family transcriptional regulator n=1 Tax=Alicyclobacillus acidoterrestris (strain ATCC 49025 / DSM 3922 / CIP 106132 / NCIMB 13137 / GD3B) TaxID=1356854 RepID=A0A9E6ZP69_ALIAG|nr:TetR/AcrR family transcriptional regulator [Alicyclobacillus acidoterrestris]UNO47870.1 TetR/AcrR family transcriptional regulator [Alicyclobacillus acidoterrestris]GEO27925.1 hypothetical protein AAC03nite_37100 [Alicyclobacillus acidoterrestris]
MDGETQATRGRPPRLSRELIVAAALQMNLESLTMRELADYLGVSHGALYRWVASRDELLDLISETLVERVLSVDVSDGTDWRKRIYRLAWAMYNEFRQVRGFATLMVRPHRHNAMAFTRFRDAIIDAFEQSGVNSSMAEQSWYIFIISVMGWISMEESGPDLGGTGARFDVFLGTLIKGLPASEPEAYA